VTRKNSTLAASGLVLGAALAAAAWRRRAAMDLNGRVALVTGGSRGLGLLIARELGRLGARVTIVARDEGELERARIDLESRGVDASILVADIARDADADRIVDSVVAREGRLDVLVNNAGVIQVGPMEHMTIADFEEAMAVHFWAPLRTMRAAIPHMRRAGGGRIVNVSSIGGKIGVPHLVPYCASKFALAGLSTSVRTELAKDKIVVTTVSPGLMRTGSPFNAWFKGRHRQEFTWFAIADSLPLMSIDAERAAGQIVDAARHGDAELVVTWPARMAVMAAAIMPNAMAGVMSLTNRFLPSPADEAGDDRHPGWQSSTRWAPSVLTRLTERAAAENNELPAGRSI
jgi:NAD(P)-dependent dehydrogenase (short-subunit alcohol dehydrogenase family)